VTVWTSLKIENTSPPPKPPIWSEWGSHCFSTFANTNTNQTAIVKHSVSVTDRVIALGENYHHSKVLGEVWILLLCSLAITEKERWCGEERGGGFDDWGDLRQGTVNCTTLGTLRTWLLRSPFVGRVCFPQRTQRSHVIEAALHVWLSEGASCLRVTSFRHANLFIRFIAGNIRLFLSVVWY